MVKQEKSIRGQVMKIYNKKQTDFLSIDDYDTYLEQIEDMIYILVDP